LFCCATDQRGNRDNITIVKEALYRRLGIKARWPKEAWAVVIRALNAMNEHVAAVLGWDETFVLEDRRGGTALHVYTASGFARR
jgi:hypothetical protein